MGSTASVELRDGQTRPTDDPVGSLDTGAELVWTAMVDAAPAEVEAVASELGLSGPLVAECRAGVPDTPVPGEPARRRRPRVGEQDGGRGIVLLPAAYDTKKEDVQLGVLTVVEQGRVVLSVARGVGPDLTALQARAASRPGHLLEHVVLLVLEGYEAVLEQLDEDVEEVEKQVFSTGRGSHAQRIYRLKRETLELQRAVGPLVDLLDRLQPPRGLHDRVLRANEHVDRLDSLLDSVLSADLSQVGVRQNEDQRRISAWAAIALVPTVVAGIYGMNFQHMPELSWEYGYPLALALIVAVCTCLYVAFTRNGWLGPGSHQRQAEDG